MDSITRIGSSFSTPEKINAYQIGSSFTDITKSIEQPSLFGGAEEQPKIASFKTASARPLDIKAIQGKYVSADPKIKQADLESKLGSYGSHSNFLQNTKEEDKPLLNSIQKIHSDTEDVRNHFNKTTGRYQGFNDKPKQLQPSMKDTLMYHGTLSDKHWQMADLPDEHKKEMDSFHSGKDFDTAVRSGNVSENLSKYLKNYDGEHANQGRKRRMFDNGDWIKPQGSDKSPLETFWHNPVSPHNADFDIEHKEKPADMERLIPDEPDVVKDEKEPEYRNYVPGEALDYAGQKHTVLKNGPLTLKTVGEDGLERDLHKGDVENIKHKPFKLDIHSDEFKNKLRGREKDSQDMVEPTIEGMRQSTTDSLKKHGFNENEMLAVHNYINADKPKANQYETGKKSRAALEKADMDYNMGNLSDEDIEKYKDKKNTEDSFDAGKDFSSKSDNYNKLKADYEKVMESHKDRFTHEMHPAKNDFYDEDKGSRRTVHDAHKLNVITPKSIKHSFQKGDEQLTPAEILGRLGIEHNDYAEKKVKDHLSKMFDSGEMSKDRRDDRGGLRAMIGLSKSIFAQKIGYISEKANYYMKKLSLAATKQLSKWEEVIKSLSLKEVFDSAHNESRATDDYLRLMLVNVTNPHRSDLYRQEAVNKSLRAGGFFKRLEEFYTYTSKEDIRKSLHSDDDNTVYSLSEATAKELFGGKK